MKFNFITGLFISFLSLPRCLKKMYRRNLPSVSVVVPFYNEHLSTLLRTAVSVITRTPSELLKEIILVDDFSSKCKLVLK